MERDLSTPVLVLKRVKNGELSKSDAAETLISLIEGSDNPEICVECVEVLDKLTYKSEKIFKILENYLISDKNPSVRDAAVKALMNNFFKESLSSILWAIQNDNSPLVLRTIVNFFKNSKEPQIYLLSQKLDNWTNKFASDIGIVPDEAKFFLDLEVLFAHENENYIFDTETYKYFQTITDYKKKENWLVLKNQHVEVLNFNYFNWNYLKYHKDYIESILKLSNPHLFLTSIQGLYFGDNNTVQIPDSIGLLTQIKKLNLSGNNLIEIPLPLKLLTSLEMLDLSKNKIQEIPEWITSLTSLKMLNLNNNRIKKIPKSIKDLKSLKDLRLGRNNIHEIPELLTPFLNSLENFKF
jgi:hypothetical protein